MQRLSVTVFALGLLLPTGCTQRIWFTQPIREGFELGVAPDPEAEADLSQPGRAPSELQYFVSDRIVLEREARSRAEGITHGRIHVRRGRYVEEVLVRRGTPGVAVDWGPDWVAISFEKGSSLIFDLVERDDDEPGHNRDVASFRGEDLPATYYRLRTRADDQGDGEVVDFGGQTYRAVGSTTSARLKVKRTDWAQHRRSRRVMRGRRID